MPEFELRPRGPYSLALTARLASDATRTFRDGLLTAALDGELVRAWQRPDGAVAVQARTDEVVPRLRFVLALDDDHTEFLRRFAGDELLCEPIRKLRGLRALRTPTVAGAVLRALCGQLIQSGRARRLEQTIVRATSAQHGDLFEPATRATLGARSPAQLRALGLHARRGATLVRLCESLDLERLRSHPVESASARLLRERGLVGDLGLVKLMSALRGRWVEPGETAELLEPYSEWAGLASVYLLAGFGRGLIPLPTGRRPLRRAA